MQNKYVGDIGDFDKYYLLRVLSGNDLKLGINWRFVKGDDENNNDGEKIGYLKKRMPKDLNDIRKYVFEKLRKIVIEDKNRNLKTIESSEILPSETKYFADEIPNGTKRFNWHKKSLDYLKKCDLIFYDPDNGLERGSYGKLSNKAKKFVFFDEIIDAFKQEKSIIIYQHLSRQKTIDDVNKRIEQLRDCLPVKEENVKTVYSSSQRYYLIIIQDKHLKNLEEKFSTIPVPYMQLSIGIEQNL